MKRIFLLFLSSFLIQMVCYAFEKYPPEGWIVDYRVCGEDTVFLLKITVLGAKKVKFCVLN